MSGSKTIDVKLDNATELMFVIQACEGCTIKAKDAPIVMSVMSKLAKLHENHVSKQDNDK